VSMQDLGIASWPEVAVYYVLAHRMKTANPSNPEPSRDPRSLARLLGAALGLSPGLTNNVTGARTIVTVSMRWLGFLVLVSTGGLVTLAPKSLFPLGH